MRQLQLQVANDTAPPEYQSDKHYYQTAHIYVITHADGSRGDRVFTSVCLSAFFRMMSQKPLQLGSPNWTKECCTMCPGNQFILEIKTPKVKVTSNKKIAGVGLCTVVSAGFF